MCADRQPILSGWHTGHVLYAACVELFAADFFEVLPPGPSVWWSAD
jgi:hypothetical protein